MNDKNELIQRLENTLQEFRYAHSEYYNGKNKKIRSQASRKMDDCIYRAKAIITRNESLYESFQKMSAIEGADIVFYQDEFFDSNYFKGDLEDFLEALKEGKV